MDQGQQYRIDADAVAFGVSQIGARASMLGSSFADAVNRATYGQPADVESAAAKYVAALDMIAVQVAHLKSRVEAITPGVVEYGGTVRGELQAKQDRWDAQDRQLRRF
jgi:hypothetical protein